MSKNIVEAYLALSERLPVEDSKVKDRLDRGYAILSDYGYEIKREKESYRVEKLSTSLLEDNSVVYKVDEESCTCPDFGTARGGLCKHRLAIMLLEEMDQ